MSTDEAFAEVLRANRTFSEDFALAELPARAARGLAVLTCMDSRIDPLRMLGLAPGDAKILRNAGARVTDDVERGLALAAAALGVTRIAIVQHTDCKLTAAGDAELIKAVAEATGRDLPGFEPLAIGDQEKTLHSDIERLLASPLLPDGVVVAGLVLDLHSGRLGTLVEPQAR